MSHYLCKAKTKEGFNIKLISEFLSNSIKFPHFYINQKGIYLRSTDPNREMLTDLDLPKENFPVFKCPKPLYFTVNSSHLYRLLKTIKKKDSVTLFIDETRPMKLGICVEQNDENSDKVTTYINIVYVQPEEIDLPEGYGDPIVVTSKHFQKLKALHSIGNEMKISVHGSVIKFFVNGKDLFSREISIGDEDDDDEQPRTYCHTFSTALITQLTKCAGQSGNIQIFYDDELPLKIKMKTGTIGTLTVYIKSKELIEMLEDDQNDNGDTSAATPADGQDDEGDEGDGGDEEENLEFELALE